MTEEKPQFNVGNGIIAGVSASAGMMLERIFFDEQNILIKGLISVVIGLATVLFLNVAIKTFRKRKGQG
jgi:hypothetical protein